MPRGSVWIMFRHICMLHALIHPSQFGSTFTLRHLGVKKSRFLRIVRVLAHSHFAQNDGVGICTCKTPDKARNYPICVILTEHAAAPLCHPEIAQQSKDLGFPEQGWVIIMRYSQGISSVFHSGLYLSIIFVFTFTLPAFNLLFA